jgi:hypothetical protein
MIADDSKEYNPDLCKNKHKEIDNAFLRVKERMDSLDRKLWIVIFFLVANLAAVSIVGIIVKSVASSAGMISPIP